MKLGWCDADGDGIRERDREAFRFSALVRPGYQQLERAALYVQAQLERVGVGMEIRSLDDTVLFERLRAGEFDALLHPLVLPVIPHPLTFYGTDSVSAAAGYHNPALAALREEMLAAWDTDRLDSLNAEFTKVLQTDVPATFLYPQVWSEVVTRRLMGLGEPD